MKGLIYKEFRQFKWYYLIALLLPLLLTWLPLLAAIDSGSAADAGKTVLQYAFDELARSPMLVRTAVAVMGFLILGMLESTVMQGDEMKKWGYFTASHPKGAVGQVYAKYVAVFAMSLLMYVSFAIWDGWFVTAAYGFAKVTLPNTYIICILMFYLQILMRALELPFIIRFGTKAGTTIKAGIILALILAGLIYLMFGPLPESLSDGMDKLMDIIAGIMDGNIPDGLTLFVAILPYVSIGAYIGSYFISKKLFMKGVEQYVK